MRHLSAGRLILETGRNHLGAGMSDFPIDPELRIRGRPDQVLRRTNKALNFVRQVPQGALGKMSWTGSRQSRTSGAR